MKMAKKILAVVLSALIVAVCFAGCSNSGPKVKVVEINLSDEEYALGVNKSDDELLTKTNEFINKIMNDGTFDEICNHFFGDGEPVGVTSAAEDSSKDQLVVATNAEFEPFEFKKGDQFYGIDMEVVKALADSLGKELVIKDMNFDSVVTAVQQGKADIAAAGLTVNEARAKQVNFTDSYYSASQQLIVKASDTKFDECKTKEDVEAILDTLDETIKIGGQNGTTGQSYVEGDLDNPDGFGFAGLKAKFTGYSNGSLAVQDLINGGVDYVIIDAAPAAAITTAINEVA
ncbi:MAG: transporter substrate-binding domain-containing protein [Acetobacter sp.]|nr:transporter substrate-binding domain-containing protein [Bacteroides sp.]MCM1341151.1 transporter substrate-binding domain-containing protein [Acetobacter sp.]MCM1433515.1 transporter substrate-binding domain-containing protein [Clostridiales bacterium]